MRVLWNTHIPQSIVTENELRSIAAVPFHIMSPKECKPIIAVVQDVALGIYRLTKKNVFLTEKQMFNLMSTNSKFFGSIAHPLKVDGDIKLWSGQQALSSIIPSTVNVRSANNSYNETLQNDKDNFVIIENGEIKQGTVDKKIYQNRSKGLIHSIYNDCNAEETKDFFDNTQKLICNWLVQSGFSVGISDLIVDDETQKNLKTFINNMKVQVYDIIKDIHMNKFENKSINDNCDFFEGEINKILNKAREQTGKMGLSKINDMENRMINMIKSGSKGSVLNVAQMIACVGQQNVDGKRIAHGFDKRTLPHFMKDDDGPDSRGFVENSFISGLSPQEFFFHSMGGREGLIDTAVKSVTADTEIIVIENGKPKCVEIGPWIDGHMDRCKDRVQRKEEKQTELLELDVEVYTPNCDSKGNVIWSPMKYITRHDPDEVLYEVETMAGRKVIVTKYDSMLVWDKKKKEFLSKPTTDIEIGEFVPVTSKMPEPPIVLKKVDVSDYLPKTEFIYGTEFFKAKTLMEEAMKDKYRIPSGWWEANNGKTFTVPYKKKARFQRVLVRSDVDNIKEGCVHNYAAQRGECDFPDSFPLDKDFGTFIGLYLAEGSCHVKTGKVSIANVDPNVLTFMRNWFDKYKITHETYSRDMDLKNKEGVIVSKGFTCSIQGRSTMLAKFLDKFVGHNAPNKFVPQEAYGAPDEFIEGVLGGYFAGDGSVGNNRLSVSSVSKRLIDGTAYLCSRLGAFGKISKRQTKKNNLGTKNILPTFTYEIGAYYLDKLKDRIDLLIDYKKEALSKVGFKGNFVKYPKLNDTTFDKIKTIVEVPGFKFKRLYDVTIPGSYNFMTGNGLSLKDTSETGYLQRKLVKAMEDCKINYDYTVRNANGSIIQFLYGEDGMDPIKIEQQSLPYIEMDYGKLHKDYNLSNQDDFEYVLDDTVTKDLKKDSNWEEPFKAHFEQILKDREFMIKTIFKSKQNNSIMYPVSFSRIINNAKMLLAKYDLKVPSDLNPRYILDTINALCHELFISKANRGDMIIGILIRCYLSPKQVIFNYKFNKDTFDHVVQQVKLRFFEAIANPSEMVGVVAAQSIGEPATQMSTSKDTLIMVYKKDKNEKNKIVPFKTTIGNFIDKILDDNKPKVVDLGNDSVVFDPTEDYYIVGVSDTEKTSWNRILQVSRHPAHGGMVKVRTRSGKTTCATLSHSFLKRSESKIVPIKGSDLKIGDRIPVAKYIPEVENALTEIDGFKLDRDFGWFCGVYLADGNINGNNIKITKIIPEYVENLQRIVMNKFGQEIKIRKFLKTIDIQKNGRWSNKQYPAQENSFNNKHLAKFLMSSFATGSNDKVIPGWVFTANLEFIQGLIGGYFDGDGNVANLDGKGMIRAHSVNEGLIEDMLLLLAYCGIFGTKALETKQEDHLQDLHTIQISRKYSKDFKNKIGFIVESKREGLEDVINYVEEPRKAQQEYIDKIPELGEIISTIGRALRLPGASRNYGRWTKKDSIGRNTLLKYIQIFTEENKKQQIPGINDKINILCQAAYSDVVWDEIVSLEYLDDPKEYVYDFTVPGNDSFMVDCGVLVHNTLNTFHHSGISSASKAVRGVPRIKELLSVTKNIKAPSMTVYLKDEFKKDKMKATEVLKSIQTTFFKDLMKSSKIYYDANDFTTDLENDLDFVNSYRELMELDLMKKYDTAPWLLRIEVNREKLLEEGINMITLYNILQEYYEDTICCMFSDDNSGNLIFRIKLIEDPNQDEDRDYITELKALEKNIMENVLIKGIKNINKSMMNKQQYQQYNEETMQFENTFEWVLDTSGTNLVDIMCHPKVDFTKTISNDINEIYELLGIEAAREALYHELSSVIADAELYVNYRHISLLVDTMTNRGYLLSIDRHGINRVDVGPLAKCSFEETTDMLIKAGIFSEVDKITGVSANIMLGQIPPCGTGDTQILIDEHKLLNNLETLDEDEEEQEDIDPTAEDVCTLDNLSFDFRVPTITKQDLVTTVNDFDVKIV